MHDTETGRDYEAPTDSSNGPDNCPHACLERTGRYRDGRAVIDLDCVDCGTIVEKDILERNVDRGRGVAADGGEDVVLTPGEDAAYCPDCEEWLPCGCDGIPPGMEIRPYEPEEGEEIATDGGEDIPLEEFRRRQRSWSTTDRDEQEQCEECGAVTLEPKSDQECGPDRENDEPYRCQNCGEHVEGTGATTSINGGASA